MKIRRPRALKKRAFPGRPTAGLRPGERASQYKRLTVRLPEEALTELIAAAQVLERPQWRVMVYAIHAYCGTGPSLTPEQRRQVQAKVRG